MMRQLGLEERNLIQTETVIRVASDEKLEVMGFVPVTVQVVGYKEKTSTQTLYITRELNKLFISRTCLLELGCLPQCWPYPSKAPQESCITTFTEAMTPSGCPARSETPPGPTMPPFQVTDTEECRDKLKD